MATLPALRLHRRRAPARPPALELDDIQGNVLRPYGFQHAAFLFVHVRDRDRARAWLAEHLGEVTSAAPWADGKPETTLNVRFTFAGLQALGLPEAALATFPETFREGMAARAPLLGDLGANSPSEWEQGLGTEILRTMIAIARQEKIRKLWGHILSENRTMQDVCKQLGFELKYSVEEGVVEASLDVT